jgi:hypothetical protein
MPSHRTTSHSHYRQGEAPSSLSASSFDDASLLSRHNPPPPPVHYSSSGQIRREPSTRKRASLDSADVPPPPPPHKTPVAKQSNRLSQTPQLTPDSKLKRRSSSPLKQVWVASSESDSGSESGFESESDPYDELGTSASEDEEDDVTNIMSRISEYPPPSAPSAIGEEESLTPSQSASQGPFREVPATEKVYLSTLAGISMWKAQTGEYVDLHPTECFIEVGPGKISAYEMITAVNSPTGFPNMKKPNSKPVAALHLTPRVIIQSLNACDILISSEPTWDSKFQTHGGPKVAKVRFHTRYATHRLALIEHIHRAMHTNPIHMALERARPKETEAEIFDRQNPGAEPAKEGRSWWGGSRRSNSFRKTHTRSGSTVGNTEHSGRTTSSIRRGLNQLLNKTTAFNIDKSTIFKKSGDSSGQGGDADADAPRDHFSRTQPHALQHTVRSARCRVVQWEKTKRAMVPKDLGKVTLHVLHPPRDQHGGTAGVDGPEGIHSGKGLRVVLANVSTTLLDRVLPPSSFSLDPRGIIVHIWAEKAGGEVASTGGVGTLMSCVVCLTGVSFFPPPFF